MAKVKSKWVCQQCGYESAGYLGKCPECNSWGSFTEEIQSNLKPQTTSPQGNFGRGTGSRFVSANCRRSRYWKIYNTASN